MGLQATDKSSPERGLAFKEELQAYRGPGKLGRERSSNSSLEEEPWGVVIACGRLPPGRTWPLPLSLNGECLLPLSSNSKISTLTH